MNQQIEHPVLFCGTKANVSQVTEKVNTFVWFENLKYCFIISRGFGSAFRGRRVSQSVEVPTKRMTYGHLILCPGFSLSGFGMGEDVAQRALLMEAVIVCPFKLAAS